MIFNIAVNLLMQHNWFSALLISLPLAVLSVRASKALCSRRLRFLFGHVHFAIVLFFLKLCYRPDLNGTLSRF